MPKPHNPRSMIEPRKFWRDLAALLDRHNVGGLSETPSHELVPLFREFLYAWNLGGELRRKREGRPY